MLVYLTINVPNIFVKNFSEDRILSTENLFSWRKETSYVNLVTHLSEVLYCVLQVRAIVNRVTYVNSK